MVSFENIRKKISIFSNVFTRSIIWTEQKNDILMFSRSRKIVGIQPRYGRAVIAPIYENNFQRTAIPGGSDGCEEPGCYEDKVSYGHG